MRLARGQYRFELIQVALFTPAEKSLLGARPAGRVTADRSARRWPRTGHRLRATAEDISPQLRHRQAQQPSLSSSGQPRPGGQMPRCNGRTVAAFPQAGMCHRRIAITHDRPYSGTNKSAVMCGVSDECLSNMRPACAEMLSPHLALSWVTWY